MDRLNNIKIVFIDIDGTLTNSNKQITEKTKESIKRIVDKGIKVVITTGRNYYYSLEKSKLSGATSIIIYSDGALIYDYEKNEIIYKSYIEKDKVMKIYDYCNKNNIQIFLNDYKQNYCNKYLEEENNYNAKIIKKKDIEKLHICQIVMVSKDKEMLNDSKQLIKNLNLQIAYIGKSFLEDNNKKTGTIDIVNNNVSKGESISYLLKYLNISKEESLCIGDHINDLDMFNACGYTVAMNNAIKKLKDKSDFITLSNDENGVAYFLDNYL